MEVAEAFVERKSKTVNSNDFIKLVRVNYHEHNIG
jgi:hypothetical protein